MFEAEAWRAALYPIGFIASLAFSARFIMQWISSEKKKESLVTDSFWKFSLFGNLLMLVHTFIQVQYPFCIIQACNAVISWRNLNLMQPAEKRRSLKFTLSMLALSLGLITLLFIFEGLFLYGAVDWVRTPTMPWESHPGNPVALTWHLMGFFGAALFAMRFWIQWWSSERKGKSVLGKSFWWCSLVGASIALIYFIRLDDWVNILGYGLGLIPYARNLMLIQKKARA